MSHSANSEQPSWLVDQSELQAVSENADVPVLGSPDSQDQEKSKSPSQRQPQPEPRALYRLLQNPQLCHVVMDTLDVGWLFSTLRPSSQSLRKMVFTCCEEEGAEVLVRWFSRKFRGEKELDFELLQNKQLGDGGQRKYITTHSANSASTRSACCG